jgi:glutathione S-transferase-like protein
VKLYVCYGTWKPGFPANGHPCGAAHTALKDAGHNPEVKLAYGLGLLGPIANFTPGRREVKRLTGNYWVPALVLDDDTVIQGSQKIAEWAEAHPAGAPSAAAV